MGAQCIKGRYPVDIRSVYQIGEKIGAGAFGQVRDCALLSTGEARAVKIIWKDEQGVSIEELMEEILCMRVMNHAYIVCLYDFFEDDKFLYCVMDKFTGKELFFKLKCDDLKESHFASYVSMMLQAIKYLRSVNVIHRDIKPENFLFKTAEPDSELCMIDFGLSQIVPNEDTYLSVCCGTVQFLSPEQIKGKYRFEVDIWAVGIIAYLLLFGRFPFTGPSDTAMMYEIIHKELTFKASSVKKGVRRQTSDLSKDLLTLILQKEPENRISPQKALEHRWITREGAVDENIEKDTIRMAYATCQSSRREANPEVQKIRDRLITDAQHHAQSYPSKRFSTSKGGQLPTARLSNLVSGGRGSISLGASNRLGRLSVMSSMAAAPAKAKFGTSDEVPEDPNHGLKGLNAGRSSIMSSITGPFRQSVIGFHRGSAGEFEVKPGDKAHFTRANSISRLNDVSAKVLEFREIAKGSSYDVHVERWVAADLRSRQASRQLRDLHKSKMYRTFSHAEFPSQKIFRKERCAESSSITRGYLPDNYRCVTAAVRADSDDYHDQLMALEDGCLPYHYRADPMSLVKGPGTTADDKALSAAPFRISAGMVSMKDDPGISMVSGTPKGRASAPSRRNMELKILQASSRKSESNMGTRSARVHPAPGSEKEKFKPRGSMLSSHAAALEFRSSIVPNSVPEVAVRSSRKIIPVSEVAVRSSRKINVT